MKKQKKAAIEMETIVKIILILISVGIIITAIYLLDLTGRIDKEACHASVLARSIKFADIVTKKAINLRCKTEHVCITLSKSGKGCGVSDAKFQINPGSLEEIQRQVQEEVTGEFYDCWWMLGEGRLNFFDESMWVTNKACVICSVLTFDDEIKNQLPKVDISGYLEKEKIPGKDETFLDYFTSDPGDILLTKLDGTGLIDTKKEYSITFSMIRSLDAQEILAKDVLFAAGAYIFASKVPILGTAVSKLWMTLPLTIKLGIVAVTLVTQSIFLEKSQIVAASHCEGNKVGCSVLYLTEYSAEELGKSCGNIESIP